MKTTATKKKPQKARVCICVRYKGKLLKLTWINEDAKGVYVGMYGAHGGLHFSYHADGKTHIKDPNGQLLSEPASQTPIASISKMQQLILSGIPLEYDETVNRNTLAFEGDAGALCVFVGGEEIETSVLNVTEFIVHRSAEAEFARTMHKPYTQLPYLKLVGFVIVPLINFPDHKVALIVSADTRATKPEP